MDIKISNGDFYLNNGITQMFNEDKEIEFKIKQLLNSTIGNLSIIHKPNNFDVSNEPINLNSKTQINKIKSMVEDVLKKLNLKLKVDIDFKILNSGRKITISFIYLPTQYKFSIFI